MRLQVSEPSERDGSLKPKYRLVKLVHPAITRPSRAGTSFNARSLVELGELQSAFRSPSGIERNTQWLGAAECCKGKGHHRIEVAKVIKLGQLAATDGIPASVGGSSGHGLAAYVRKSGRPRLQCPGAGVFEDPPADHFQLQFQAQSSNP